MSTVGYEQDPTEMILSQLRLEHSQTTAGMPKPSHAYFQVQYMAKHVFKMNPEQAEIYERSVQEETLREYLEQSRRDKQREDTVKYDLKRKFFKLRQLRPLNPKQYTIEGEPIQMLKSFSQPAQFMRKSSLPLSLIESRTSLPVTARSRVNQKIRYAQSFQQLLDQSQKMGRSHKKYHLVGGTMIEKDKMNEEIMRAERRDILGLIRTRDYSLHRPQKLQEINNKEKYGLGYLEYMLSKTKLALDKSLFQKKIRRIEGKLQNFQEFILREGKMKEAPRAKLENFYIKMREEFRRIERNHSPKAR